MRAKASITKIQKTNQHRRSFLSPKEPSSVHRASRKNRNQLNTRRVHHPGPLCPEVKDHTAPVLAFVHKDTPDLGAVKLQSKLELCNSKTKHISTYVVRSARAVATYLCRIRSGAAWKRSAGNSAGHSDRQSICTVPLSRPVEQDVRQYNAQCHQSGSYQGYSTEPPTTSKRVRSHYSPRLCTA